MMVKDRSTVELAKECLIIADWNISALPLTEENREVIKELANRVLIHFDAIKTWKDQYSDFG